MSMQKATFVLIGPHEGKTMTVNGREFVDGEFEFEGSEQEIRGLTNLFSYYGVKPKGEAVQVEETETVGSDANDAKVDEDVKPDLAEAMGLLDPDDDAHWTSNNLPSLDFLAEATGGKVTRAQVDAIADGFTRAKAKALRESLA